MILYKRKYISLLILSFITLSINLRAPITALPPIIGEVQHALQMGATVSGILTTIPVLCFGLFTPLASRLIARIGLEQAIIWTLSGVIIGSVIRVFGTLPLMLGGTVLIGIALTVGNLLGILIIGRDFKGSANFMTGVMVLGMSLGGMITSSLTSPLAQQTDWRFALLSWSLLALISLLCWLRTITRRTHKARRAIDSLAVVKDQPTARKPVRLNEQKKSAVIFLTCAFACHCFAFYGIVAWLPRFLAESGGMNENQAGLVVSIFHLLGFIGCLGIPVLTKRFNLNATQLFMLVGVTWFLVPTGFYLLPQYWPVWDIMGGIGCGGAYVVIFMQILANSASLDENRRISSVVQCSGYILASLAPMVIGGLYEYSGGWSLAFLCLSLVTLVFMGSGIMAHVAFEKSKLK